MLTATKTALATLFVLVSASAVLAESHNRAARSKAPPARVEQRNPTTNSAVKPFTAEEKGWFDRASRVY